MAKAAKAPSWKTPRLTGKTLCVTGKLECADRQNLQKLIEREGGQLVDSVSAKLDILIVGTTRGARPASSEKQAEKLNAKGATIQVIDEAGFLQLVLPTREQAIAMLKERPHGVEAWNEIFRLCHGGKVDLSNADFRKVDLTNANLDHANVDDCDFREADLTNIRIDQVSRANFEKAFLYSARIKDARDCSFTQANARRCEVWRAPGCNCDGADFSQGGVGILYRGSARNAIFEGTHLRSSVWSHTDCTGANFSDAHGDCTTFTEAALSGTIWRDADLRRTGFLQANLEKADMSKAKLGNADFSAANLTGANLSDSDLSDAKFYNANLTRTSLCRALLNGTALNDAVIEQTDFSDANIVGIKVEEASVRNAVGWNSQALHRGQLGPQLKELDRVTIPYSKLDLAIDVTFPDGRTVHLSVTSTNSSNRSCFFSYEKIRDSEGVESDNIGPHGRSLAAIMLAFGDRWGQGSLDFNSCNVTGKSLPLKKPEFVELVLQSWCEAFGVPAPSAEDLKRAQDKDELNRKAAQDRFLADLKAGNVKEWNELPHEERKYLAVFRRTDLTGLSLQEANFVHADFQGAKFANTQLQQCNFEKANLAKTHFAGANLSRSMLWLAKLADADFSGANLSYCNLVSCSLLRTNFRDAILTGSDLSFSDMRSADFSGASLKQVTFNQTKYNEHTTFPKGFQPGEGLIWAGSGQDQRHLRAVQAVVAQASAPVDFETFFKQLEQTTDASRFKNVLKMLKAERFQLFSVVDADSVTGVVKSQSDPDLVYGCRLSGDGTFSCCTQNLNVCGGLRGGLCKHLLVLLVGLAKSEELEPGRLNGWIAASRLHKPELDKDRMSEIFLRYKGAEAGDIDWRPTETVPEDFYAF